MLAHQSSQPQKFLKSKVSLAGEEEEGQIHEPTSSKDTLTRVHSPRTSKSSGTVIQTVDGESKALEDRQSEECTSSASELCQEPSVHMLNRPVLKDISNTHQNYPGNVRSKQEEDKGTDLKSTQSSHNRHCNGEDEKDRLQSETAKKQQLPGKTEIAQCHNPSRIQSNLQIVPQPAEDPGTQKLKHKSSKQKSRDFSQLEAKSVEEELQARESNGHEGVPNLFAEADCKAERDLQNSQSILQPAKLENGNLSRACSTVGAPKSQKGFEGQPRETDATSPVEFPQILKKQRSKLGQRGRQCFKHPGKLEAHEGSIRPTRGRGSATLKKPSSAWGLEWRGLANDDDYMPPGCVAESPTAEMRVQRSSRIRSFALDQEDIDQQRSDFASRDSTQSRATLASTPSRSTRSRPMDYSPLWPDFYPTVTTAKRCRGFTLNAALGRLAEVSEQEDADMKRSPHTKRTKLLWQPEAEQLLDKVELSLDRLKDQRQSFADFLGGNSITSLKSQRSELTERCKDSALGKILCFTSEHEEEPELTRTADEIMLPIDSMTERFVRPHLEDWQNLLQQSGDPCQSSVRKRHQTDVEHVWEDFYESQAFEQSVLSDLHEWLKPKAN